MDFKNLRLDDEEISQSCAIEDVSINEIAIIGMAIQAPGAENMDRFWENLQRGFDQVGPFPEGRLEDVKPYLKISGLEDDLTRYHEGSFFQEIDKFDYSFFRISPKEASLMNPNQRLFLENSWKAIEDAGYGGEKIRGTRTGVFVGYNGDAFHDYKRLIDRFEPDVMSLAITGNLSSMMAGRLSYLLDLKGQAMTVDTACSSSLVAVHMAVRALRNRECEMAIAGSAKVNILPFHKDIRIGIESSDARARTFDDRSDGTGAGEGGGTVLLKPLYAAKRDGDHIYAVIKGSAVNQDGRSSGLTAPDAGAQTDVICKAWEDAGINPETVGYVEAHGTGTKLGDPIEIEALQSAFRRYTDRRQFCSVGTLKTNIGHLDHAAGIAGLIKTALIMKHQAIPPIVHFERPNRKIDFIDSPVYVNDRNKPLEPAGNAPRRCGISSFGMSGTNCHVVLEEAPLREASPHRVENEAALFVLSAQSHETLLGWIDSYMEQADRLKSLSIKDICYTVATGRAHLSYRLAMLVRDTDDLWMKLKRISEIGLEAESEHVYFGNAGNAGELRAADLEQMRDDKAGICRLYVEGADIEWESFYSDENRYKASLPTYPFKRTRCWVDMDHGAIYSSAAPATPGAKASQAVVLTGKESEVDYSAADRTIAAIWSDVLGVRQIGVDDHFFELGGDSILALWVTNRLNESFQTRWDPTAIFQFPTIREIAAAIATEDKADDSLHFPEPQAAKKRERYPLSSAQKRLYILQQFEPASTAYHLPQALLLEGPLDPERLKNTFQALLDRHEIFRASFYLDGDEPVQSFADRLELSIESVEAAESDVPDYIHRFIRPFDLAKDPLIRLLLLRISEQKHVLLVDKHHLISDGTSMGILIRELMQLYHGQALPAPALQYKDYAVWQHEMARSPFMEVQRDYWLNAFRGEVPVLQLPTDFSRPPVKSAEGKTFEVALDGETVSRIKQLAKERETTLFMVLLAAYNVLLHRYTGQDDIVVGSPISGRPHHNLESLVGMFVNTLALRNFPAKEKSFLHFMNEVKENAILAYRHQDYPFEDLVHSLCLQDKSRNPLFDTMLILQNIDIPEISLDELSVAPYPIENNTAKFDLMIQTYETENGLRFVVEYCAKLFKEETVQRMMRHYLKILQEVALQPETPIGHIQMLADDDVRLIVNEFNNSESWTFPPRPIHCLFEEQADHAPDRTALVWKDQLFTYRELNERSNQFAHLLRSKGVGPDSVVGIVAERSPELVIGMMAILKAGGAYLPIDPQLPLERIQYMLKDSGTKVVCMQEEWRETVSFEGETILLTGSVAANERISNPGNINEAGDLMYVIYTSGSTGQPKGVMVEHQSLHHFAYSIREHFGGQFGYEDRCLSLTSISFDVSVCELFLPLIFGSVLVLYPMPKLTDMNALANLLVEESISFAYLPPTLLNDICDLLEPERHKVKLDKLLVGVEPIKDWTLERYLQLNPEMRIINGYGPTETTICSNMHIYGSQKPAGKNVPIGKPMHKNQNYILNEALMPVPIGVAGELYISGAGLARGYLHRPDLTLERFIENPFIPGTIMYRTGDLTRWKENGEAEYIGRTDFQVKIRGYRVEPGEIEALMLSLPNIQSAVVIPIEEQSGYKALCAYVVSRAHVPVAQMRSELLRYLPDYMVPSYFVEMEDIPVTANGKIDRKALPHPESMQRSSDNEYVAPRNEREAQLEEVWKEILELPRVSVYDDFFELGGNSLKLIYMKVALEKRNLMPEDENMLSVTTIAGLAAAIQSNPIKVWSDENGGQNESG
ncbi:non-ribosomal peptide synthetase [Paenibacillus endophyticus]|nr:non-ribosomal peptide synthetase [Paenibacillus endophyticus]